MSTRACHEGVPRVRPKRCAPDFGPRANPDRPPPRAQGTKSGIGTPSCAGPRMAASLHAPGAPRWCKGATKLASCEVLLETQTSSAPDDAKTRTMLNRTSTAIIVPPGGGGQNWSKPGPPSADLSPNSVELGPNWPMPGNRRPNSA